MTPKFSQVRLMVDDFAAAFRFYRDVMGFKPNFGDEEEVYADFDAGGTQLALFGRRDMAEAIGVVDKPAPREAQVSAVVVFEVENVDQAVQDLAAKGVAIVAPPTDRAMWGMRTAHFRDPSGNLIEIFHALPMDG